LTTVSLFRFSGLADCFWALSRMGIAPLQMKGTPGLTFFKMLGSGDANGFSIRPNWRQYGLLCVWENEDFAKRFFQENTVFQDYKKRATVWQTAFLKPTMFHGSWDGANPFTSAAEFDPALPVAVLTRATIKKRYLWRFWRQVPRVSADVEDRPGLLFAVGVGELPLIQQATFSLWQSGKAMLDYAYRRNDHSAVIKKTRELGWYSEEMFVRFLPYHSEGAGFWDVNATSRT